MNFKKALEEMKKGKSITRESTGNQEWRLYLGTGKGEKDFVYNQIIKEEEKPKCWNLINVESLEATDWIIWEREITYSNEEAERCVKFVRHVKKHLPDCHEVQCKICDKFISQIENE